MFAHKVSGDKGVENPMYRPIGTNSGAVSIEMDLVQVGSEPVGMRCPHCHEDVMTTASYRTTAKTHVIAALLGVFFWWLCCCFLPYLVRRWKNVNHYCPNCNEFLGVYIRSSII